MIDDYLYFLNEQELLYEEVLYFVAESRWKRLLAAGKLTKKQLRRIQKYKGAPDPLYVKQLLKKGKIQQANQYIKNKGIIKTAKDWLIGVEKGTQNILKRYGAKIKHTEHPRVLKASNKVMKKKSGGSADILRRTPAIYVPSGSTVKKKERGEWIITKRHEADEIRVGRKLMKKAKEPFAVFGAHTFSHISPEVLAKERELVRTAKALYGRHGGGREYSKLRAASREYKYLDNIKGKIRKQDIKAIKNVDKAIAHEKSRYKEFFKEKKALNKVYGNLVKEKIKIEKNIKNLKTLFSKCKTEKCKSEIKNYLEKSSKVQKRIEKELEKNKRYIRWTDKYLNNAKQQLDLYLK